MIYEDYKPYVAAKAAELAADKAHQKAADKYSRVILINSEDTRAVARAAHAMYRAHYKALNARQRLWEAECYARYRSES
jgi:hypothetical protein